MTDAEIDIQRLWHDQPREEHALSIDVIRSKAEQFEQRSRRWNLVTAGLFLLLLAVEGWQVWREPALLERIGDLLTIAALIYLLFGFRGYAAPQSMPRALGLTSSVDFYRKQLSAQRELASRPWRYLVLFIPGVGLSLFGRSLERPPGQTAAIAALGVATFLAVAWINRRTARRLQREIDELG